MKFLGATYLVWNLLKVWVGFAWYAAVAYTVYLAWNDRAPWWSLAVVWIGGWLLVLLFRVIETAALNAAMHVAAKTDDGSD